MTTTESTPIQFADGWVASKSFPARRPYPGTTPVVCGPCGRTLDRPGEILAFRRRLIDGRPRGRGQLVHLTCVHTGPEPAAAPGPVTA